MSFIDVMLSQIALRVNNYNKPFEHTKKLCLSIALISLLTPLIPIRKLLLFDLLLLLLDVLLLFDQMKHKPKYYY